MSQHNIATSSTAAVQRNKSKWNPNHGRIHETLSAILIPWYFTPYSGNPNVPVSMGKSVRLRRCTGAMEQIPNPNYVIDLVTEPNLPLCKKAVVDWL
jgi:hypothetical protein